MTRTPDIRSGTGGTVPRSGTPRRIGVYNEPSGTLGGSDYLVATLAAALASQHDVEIVHHNPSLTADQLAGFTGADASLLRLRYAAREPYPSTGLWDLRRRYQAQRSWHAALSERYDLFVNVTHGIPPFCHAAVGVLLVLFPDTDREALWSRHYAPAVDGRLARRLVRGYFDWEWRRRFGSYRVSASISEFVQTWSRRWWGIDTTVIYPPVDVHFHRTEKSNIIVSVGRFATSGVMKNQLEMAGTFVRMRESGLDQWEHWSVGGLGDRPEDRAYFESVQRLAAGRGARVIANIARSELRALYERAKVFWHAAGYGSAGDNPFLTEHFGIATIEAMAAGCVPVVIRRGAQPEIVKHGVTGFLWDTLEELEGYTARLVRDEPLRARMAEAARAGAQQFGAAEFVHRCMRILTPML